MRIFDGSPLTEWQNFVFSQAFERNYFDRAKFSITDIGSHLIRMGLFP